MEMSEWKVKWAPAEPAEPVVNIWSTDATESRGPTKNKLEKVTISAAFPLEFPPVYLGFNHR